MAFGWDDAALIGGSLLTNMSQPDQSQLPGNLVATSPTQFKMYDQLVQNFLSGGGDYGYGSTMKSGNSQLQQFMADRGISADSGVYQSAMADLIAQSAATDASNRYNYGLNLLNSPPATAVITGENQIPGAAAAGYGGTLSTTNSGISSYLNNYLNSDPYTGEAAGTGMRTSNLVWDPDEGTYVPA